ncbi:hypothetical protein L7F22_029676 [Adiantum nelumboides]|nr:hypothetical protein [Adiantum nelumboides]
MRQCRRQHRLDATALTTSEADVVYEVTHDSEVVLASMCNPKLEQAIGSYETQLVVQGLCPSEDSSVAQEESFDSKTMTCVDDMHDDALRSFTDMPFPMSDSLSHGTSCVDVIARETDACEPCMAMLIDTESVDEPDFREPETDVLFYDASDMFEVDSVLQTPMYDHGVMSTRLAHEGIAHGGEQEVDTLLHVWLDTMSGSDARTVLGTGASLIEHESSTRLLLLQQLSKFDLHLEPMGISSTADFGGIFYSPRLQIYYFSEQLNFTDERLHALSIMISQFFVLSLRGDNIIFRDYRADVPKSSAEIFFRNVKFWKGEEGEEAPPVFDKHPLLKQDPLPMAFGIEEDLDKIGDEMIAVIFNEILLLDSTLLHQHLPPLSLLVQDYALFVMVIIGDTEQCSSSNPNKGKQAVRAIRVSKVVTALMLNANNHVSAPINFSNEVLSLLRFVGKHPLNVLVDSGCSTNFSWLYQYDPIISFRDHSIRLYHDNQELELRGIFDTKPITMVSAMQVKRLVRKRDCTTALVMHREAEDDTEVQSEVSTTDADYLQKPFFHQFLDLFPGELPTTLPPRRPVDHTINLIHGQYEHLIEFFIQNLKKFRDNWRIYWTKDTFDQAKALLALQYCWSRGRMALCVFA